MAYSQTEYRPFVWKSGSSSSPALDLTGFERFSLITPASFEPTTVKVQSDDGAGTFNDIQDSAASAMTFTAAATKAITLPTGLESYDRIKLVQTAGGAPAADRACVLICRN
jgi:hypothetical protein